MIRLHIPAVSAARVRDRIGCEGLGRGVRAYSSRNPSTAPPVLIRTLYCAAASGARGAHHSGRDYCDTVGLLRPLEAPDTGRGPTTLRDMPLVDLQRLPGALPSLPFSVMAQSGVRRSLASVASLMGPALGVAQCVPPVENSV